MVLDVGRHGGAVDMELVGAGKAADLLLMTASLCARSVWNIKSRQGPTFLYPLRGVLVSTMARCV